MINSRQIAFLVAVAVHILLLYMLSTTGAHLSRYKETAKSLSVTLIMVQPVPVDIPNQRQQDVSPRRVPKHVAATPALVPASTPTSTHSPSVLESKEVAAVAVPPVSASGVLLAQSALNAVGKMDQDERRATRSGANVLSNSLGERLSSSMAKYAPAKAGTIDENIYPDGRREERVHTLFGGEYCITFESPSNPVDGFDIMQRGMRPGVPHTCGHRFD